MSDTTWNQYSMVGCTVSGIHGQSHLCYVSQDIYSVCEKSNFIILKEHFDEQFIPKILKIKIEKDKSKMNANSLSVCSCASSRILRPSKDQPNSPPEDVNSNRKTVVASFIGQDKLVKLVRNCSKKFISLSQQFPTTSQGTINAP